jgi:hypothetical protein
MRHLICSNHADMGGNTSHRTSLLVVVVVTRPGPIPLKVFDSPRARKKIVKNLASCRARRYEDGETILHVAACMPPVRLLPHLALRFVPKFNLIRFRWDPDPPTSTRL